MNSHHLSQLLTTAYRCSLLPSSSLSPRQTSIPSQVTLLSFSSSVLWRLSLRSLLSTFSSHSHVFLNRHLSVRHPCLWWLFYLVLTVFSYLSSLTAFKLISINSSCLHEALLPSGPEWGGFSLSLPWQACKKVSWVWGDQFAQLHQATVSHAAMETMDKTRSQAYFIKQAVCVLHLFCPWGWLLMQPY